MPEKLTPIAPETACTFRCFLVAISFREATWNAEVYSFFMRLSKVARNY